MCIFILEPNSNLMIHRITLLLFVLLGSFSLLGQEICTNSIDDDGDGLIDLLDPDCDCSGILTGQVQSFIPNPSFEDMTCCPNSYSDLGCAETWVQASAATSDYFHHCDFMPGVIPQPLPEGDACVGAFFVESWKEYVGACLNTTFEASESYLLNFKISSAILTGTFDYVSDNNLGTVEITVYGSPDCNSLPFGGDDCPLNSPGGADWYVLGTYDYNPTYTWEEISIELNAPVDINSVVIGAPCDLPANYPQTTNGGPYPYFWYDELILNEAGAFNATVSDTYFKANDSGNMVELDNSVLSSNPAYQQFCFDEMELGASPGGVGGTYQWFLDGIAIPGENDTVFSSVFEEYESGIYTFGVFLNEDTCEVTSIEVVDPLYPTASMMAEDVCTPGVGDLTALPDGVTELIDWDWVINQEAVNGNGFISYTYNNNTEYDVKLIVHAENYCTDTVTSNLLWPTFPEVDFGLTEVCENFATEFTDFTVNPDGSAYSLAWTFPGAIIGSSVADNPVNSYANFGQYPVTLTVESTEGCLKSKEDSILIHPTPQALFSVDPLCFDSPVEVFEDMSTLVFGNIAETVWSFGDGGTSTESEPLYEYVNPGTYNVNLHVTSDIGCTDSITLVQIVSEVVASFDYSDPSGCHPIVVDFESTSTSSDGDLVAYDWDFNNGDAAVTDFEQPEFTNFEHEDNAYYDVVLTVEDEYGCTDSIHANQLIEVWPLPKAQFETELDFSNPVYPLATFTNTSIGAEKYDWEFGDGETADTEHTYHYFVENEQYLVKMTATSSYACQDTALKFLNIPALNYIYVPTGFTPNGDGANEYFEPIVTGPVADYSLEIVDRWGSPVFSSSERGERWNGSYFNEQNYYVPDGIYVYRLVVRFEKESEDILNEGFVTILR